MDLAIAMEPAFLDEIEEEGGNGWKGVEEEFAVHFTSFHHPIVS
jgi:hypothetical protein